MGGGGGGVNFLLYSPAAHGLLRSVQAFGLKCPPPHPPPPPVNNPSGSSPAFKLISYNILRKKIEGYQNSFDYKTVEKIISIQDIFVSDRTTNMQFNRMQNKIYESLVTIQSTPNEPTLFTKSSQAKKIAFIFFAATFTWSLLIF